jgi:hypothetical protein
MDRMPHPMKPCRFRQDGTSFDRMAVGLFCPHMKKTNNKVKQHRSLRRFVKRLFSSVIKRQSCNCAEEVKKVFEVLSEMRDSIEIIARQVARWAKIEPGDQ